MAEEVKSQPKMAPNQRNWIPKMVPNMSERPENGFKVHVDEKCEQKRQKLAPRPCLKQCHGSRNEISAQNGTKSKKLDSKEGSKHV